MQMREKVGKSQAKHCVFPMICGSGGSKSRLAKAAGAEPAGQMRDEKVHVVVARSMFPRFSKSKCTKHTMSDMFGPLLEVAMSKKCTPLWREAHFEVKMLKNQGPDHFLRFRCRFAWQAQGIVHLVKSEQNVRALWHFQKRWQAWDMWRGSAKMHFAWQAQYKRHVHERC